MALADSESLNLPLEGACSALVFVKKAPRIAGL